MPIFTSPRQVESICTLRNKGFGDLWLPLFSCRTPLQFFFCHFQNFSYFLDMQLMFIICYASFVLIRYSVFQPKVVKKGMHF